MILPTSRGRNGWQASGSGSRPRAAPATYLIAKGFRIVARRYRSPVGEVDIVARA
jgi:putative endonuclease